MTTFFGQKKSQGSYRCRQVEKSGEFVHSDVSDQNPGSRRHQRTPLGGGWATAWPRPGKQPIWTIQPFWWFFVFFVLFSLFQRFSLVKWTEIRKGFLATLCGSSDTLPPEAINMPFRSRILHARSKTTKFPTFVGMATSGQSQNTDLSPKNGYFLVFSGFCPKKGLFAKSEKGGFFRPPTVVGHMLTPWLSGIGPPMPDFEPLAPNGQIPHFFSADHAPVGGGNFFKRVAEVAPF